MGRTITAHDYGATVTRVIRREYHSISLRSAIALGHECVAGLSDEDVIAIALGAAELHADGPGIRLHRSD